MGRSLGAEFFSLLFSTTLVMSKPKVTRLHSLEMIFEFIINPNRNSGIKIKVTQVVININSFI